MEMVGLVGLLLSVSSSTVSFIDASEAWEWNDPREALDPFGRRCVGSGSSADNDAENGDAWVETNMGETGVIPSGSDPSGSVLVSIRCNSARIDRRFSCGKRSSRGSL